MLAKLIKTFIFTLKKNKAMKSLILAINQCKIDTLPDYEKFYCFLNKNVNFKHVFENYDLTAKNLHDISLVFLALGFEWRGNEYIPVHVISFIKPLTIIGVLKNVFYNGTVEEQKEACNRVIYFLDSYM